MKSLFLTKSTMVVAVVSGTLVAGIALAAPKTIHNHAVCGPQGQGTARCHAHVVDDGQGNPVANATVPSGYGPTQFLKAYGLSGQAVGTPTIAIVDAYDDQNAESDLAVYSKQYGLPSCTTANGCFRKINQRGGTSYPARNAGWALEVSLDVQVAHAVCQNCRILLVEADSNSFANLMAAVDQARLQGAKVISNSYGGSEFSGETSYDDSHFNFKGVAFTVSSGDSGYGVEYPAASQYVTAVGGTTLNLNADGSYKSESAWTGAGSGCSAYETKPIWQTDGGCVRRTVADVSADADPNTGAAVYDSVRYQGRSGWFQVGGTSLAAPLVAAVYAQAGALPATDYAAHLPYLQGASLHDVLLGANGSCGGTYLCTSLAGYDGPTGLGSPNTAAAF